VQTWLEKNYKLCLLILCFFAFVVRFYRVGEIQSYIFDEVYHTVTAKLIARNDVRAYEWWNDPIEPNTAVDWLHPPLAKYTQALGIKVFGETPMGWRISSVLFGVGVIYLTAELARLIFKDKRIALIAAFLASLDGLLLVQSRLAMNDIHVTFWLLLTFIVYFWYRQLLQKVIDHPQQLSAARSMLFKRLVLSGICAGVAMGTKWSGLFGLGVIWFFELLFLLTKLSAIAPTKVKALKTLLARFIILVALPFAVYFLSYTHMFLQGKSFVCELDRPLNGECYCSQESSTWVSVMKTVTGNDTFWESLEARGGCKRLISHFSELHHQIIWYQTTLEATHNYQSRPLEWFLNLRPVWMYVKYDEGKIANIYAQGNPVLFWFGDLAVITTVLALFVHMFKQLNKKVTGKSKGLLHKVREAVLAFTDVNTGLGKLFYLAVAYFAVWFPWNLSPRIMFFYHYTPAVPLLAILLAYWMMRVWRTYKHGLLYVGLVLLAAWVVFLLFFPNWTGIPVNTKFANSVYFSIKSWK